MNSWESTTLDDLYGEPSRNGLTRPKSVRGSGYRMINMGEIFAHERIGNIEMERVQMTEKEIASFEVKKGDLLFARQSLVLSGAGKCSLVKFIGETTTFESHLIRVRLNPKCAVPDFFFYYFISSQGKQNVQSIVMQVAAAGIRGSELAKLKVPVPPLPVQRKIAAILSAYDDLIENNERRIRILEDMAQNLYREWFVKFRFPGHTKVKMVDSPLGKIPQGWEVIIVSELVDSCVGGGWGLESPDGDETHPVAVIRGTDFKDLRRGEVAGVPRRFIKESALTSRKLRHGDLVLENSVNASSRCVGTPLFITEGLLKRIGGDVICASFCRLFRFKDVELAMFLYHHIRYLMDEGKMRFYQNVAANGIGNFQATRFVANETVALPATPELRRDLIDALSSFTPSHLSERIGVIRQTRDLLLPKLISGEVDVSELDIRIPESAA